jgi:hypothetical protein
MTTATAKLMAATQASPPVLPPPGDFKLRAEAVSTAAAAHADAVDDARFPRSMPREPNGS